MYSASQDEVATVCCRFELQEIGPPPEGEDVGQRRASAIFGNVTPCPIGIDVANQLISLIS
jgi:hypothetical protein